MTHIHEWEMVPAVHNQLIEAKSDGLYGNATVGGIASRHRWSGSEATILRENGENMLLINLLVVVDSSPAT